MILKHPTRREFERKARGPSGGGFYASEYGAFHLQVAVRASCADDEVLVVVYDEDGIPEGAERVQEAIADKQGWKPLSCNSCLLRPAKRLDGHFPYETDFNRCDECTDAGIIVYGRNPDDYPGGSAY